MRKDTSKTKITASRSRSIKIEVKKENNCGKSTQEDEKKNKEVRGKYKSQIEMIKTKKKIKKHEENTTRNC